MQVYHEDPTRWPIPLGGGLLIEIDYVKTETSITLLNDGLFNIATARVRAASPALSDSKLQSLLPDGNGSFGKRVLFSEPNVRYLEEAEYDICGFERPNPETNGKGDLGFITYDRIIAIMKEDATPEELPFTPLGSRVFFEFDIDDQSDDEVELESGLILQEKTLAADNQLATVTGVGPNCKYLKAGDRIIAKRFSSSVAYEGKTYYFVSDEHDIFAII